MKVRLTPQGRDLEFLRVRSVKTLLKRLAVLEGTVLVIRGKNLLTADAGLAEDDQLEIRSVVSGG